MSKELNALKKFLNANIEDIEIIQEDRDLYRYKGRYYHSQDTRRVIYGDPWYEQNYYKDYGPIRCSCGYYTCHGHDKHGKSSRSLHVGSENVYTWKESVPDYKRNKSKAQIRAITKQHIKRLVKDFEAEGKEIDFDLDTVRKLLNYTLWQVYGDWLDPRKRN